MEQCIFDRIICQVPLIDVEFLTIVFREMVGKKLAIWPSIISKRVTFWAAGLLLAARTECDNQLTKQQHAYKAEQWSRLKDSVHNASRHTSLWRQINDNAKYGDSLLCGIRGFHVYKKFGKQYLGNVWTFLMKGNAPWLLHYSCL